MRPTQTGKRMSQGLHGVRQAARARKQERFTALLYHLNVALLRESFYALKRQASPGVDGVTSLCPSLPGLRRRLPFLVRLVHGHYGTVRLLLYVRVRRSVYGLCGPVLIA